MTRRQPGHLVHEAALFDSEQVLVDQIVPLVRTDVAEGVTTHMELAPDVSRTLESVLAGVPETTFARRDPGRSPLAEPQRLRGMTEEAVRLGATGLSFIASMRSPPEGSGWHAWRRYEAAVNHLLADLPLHLVCVYDLRDTPAYVIDDVSRTHPVLNDGEGARRDNPRFTHPEIMLREPGTPDPVERTPPTVSLVSPTSATARQAVRLLCRGTSLDDDAIDRLTLAASEVVANAHVHGRPPVELRGWAVSDRIVVTVSDRGQGPESPYAGLSPAADHGLHGGQGLWLVHHVCEAVGMRRSGEGFLVRLVVGGRQDLDLAAVDAVGVW